MANIFDFEDFIRNTKEVSNYELVRQVNGTEFCEFFIDRNQEEFTRRETIAINYTFMNMFFFKFDMSIEGMLDHGNTTLVSQIAKPLNKFNISRNFLRERTMIDIKIIKYEDEYFSFTCHAPGAHRYFIIDSIDGFEELKNILLNK